MPRRLFARVGVLLALGWVLAPSADAQRVVSVPISASAPAVRLAPPVLTHAAPLPTLSAPSALMSPAAEKPLNLLFIGPPGVGKTTFGKLAAEEYGMVHISVGELLRVKAAQDPELAQTMARGDLVSSDLVRQVVADRLARPDVKEHGFILDGFPRRPEEAGVIESWLRDGGSIDAMVHLEAPDAELLRRILARGRMDDSEEIFRKRLEIYRRQTKPVLERFRNKLTVLETETAGSDITANYEKVRALLNGLYDGRRGPSDEGAPQASVARRLAKSRYEAKVPGASASFTLTEGALKTEVMGAGLDHHRELSRALKTFGRGVRAVEGDWARTTAQAAGFTVEHVDPADGRTLFVRPEAIFRDNAGHPWLATRRFTLHGADWTLYRRGGRAIWLVRRMLKDGYAVYEYEGPGIPKPGTPAVHHAVFSAHEGVLSSHIMSDGATLLDPVAEARIAEQNLLH